MGYTTAQQSNQGGREYNEDRTAIFEREGHIILVLADGLGGHEGGEIASQGLVDSVGKSFLSATEVQLQDPEKFLDLTINYAHKFIHRRAKQYSLPAVSPKTTCVLCLISDGVARWAHSGDSRLYLIRGKEILDVTKDHVADKQLANNPLNRCVGGHELPNPDISKPVKLKNGDRILLASDGAWATFKVDDLYDYVDPEHPSFGLDNLLQRLESRNKVPSDNLSMVLLFWDEALSNNNDVYDHAFVDDNTHTSVKQEHDETESTNAQHNNSEQALIYDIVDQGSHNQNAEKQSSSNQSKNSTIKAPPQEKPNLSKISESIDEIENFISGLEDNL